MNHDDNVEYVFGVKPSKPFPEHPLDIAVNALLRVRDGDLTGSEIRELVIEAIKQIDSYR